jgi:NAD-dependent deacetylase
MIVFLTGAGVSVPSGLPTYRGVAGLYNDDTVEEGYRIEEILSRKVANEHPELTKKYEDKIAAACAAAEPNSMHEAIAAVQKEKGAKIYTQNVDDLHERGGATEVIHLHGGGAKKEPVVLFGDMLPEEQLFNWLDDSMYADTLVVIGTTAQFPYISEPIRQRQYMGLKTILLDPDESHPLSWAVTEHHSNPETFTGHIKRLLE